MIPTPRADLGSRICHRKIGGKSKFYTNCRIKKNLTASLNRQKPAPIECRLKSRNTKYNFKWNQLCLSRVSNPLNSTSAQLPQKKKLHYLNSAIYIFFKVDLVEESEMLLGSFSCFAK